MQHYTNQLAKETNKHLKKLGSLPLPQAPSEQVSSFFHQKAAFKPRAVKHIQVLHPAAAEDPEGPADERLLSSP